MHTFIIIAVIAVLAVLAAALVTISHRTDIGALLMPDRPVVKYRGNQPRRQHRTDAGADLKCSETTTIHPGTQMLIGTGTYLEIPHGHYGEVVPRSSLPLKYDCTVANSPGIIDQDYRGEIKVNVYNFGTGPVTFQAGERIAQLLIHEATPVEFKHTTHLSSTERGTGGHGSTGKD